MRCTALHCLAVAVGLRARAGQGRTSCGPGTVPGCPCVVPSWAVPSRKLQPCPGRALCPGAALAPLAPGPPGSVSLAKFCSGLGQLRPPVPTLSCSPLCSGCSESRFPGTIPAPRCSSSGCSFDLETANSSFFLRMSQAVLLALSACGTRPWHSCRMPAQPGFGRSDTGRRRGFISVTF